MGWSSLSDDLLREIARKLEIFDFVRFRVVCKSWRTAVQPADLPPQLPWLMLYDKNYKGDIENCFLYNLGAETFYVLHLPEFRNKRFFGGSSDGWLVLLDKNSGDTQVLSLLQPLTRSHISLPLLKTGTPVTHTHLSSSPTSGWHTVVAWNRIRADKLYCYKLGPDTRWSQWTIIPTSIKYVRTVVVSRDQENIYAVNYFEIFHFDLKNKASRLIPLPDNICRCEAYLAVASSGELLLAAELWQTGGPNILEVHSLKDEGWVKPKERNIDIDQAIYLSPCQTFSSDVRHSDHVYLAYSNYIQLFSLKDGSCKVQRIPWLTAGDHPERLHHSTWFIPSLCP